MLRRISSNSFLTAAPPLLRPMADKLANGPIGLLYPPWRSDWGPKPPGYPGKKSRSATPIPTMKAKKAVSESGSLSSRADDTRSRSKLRARSRSNWLCMSLRRKGSKWVKKSGGWLVTFLFLYGIWGTHTQSLVHSLGISAGAVANECEATLRSIAAAADVTVAVTHSAMSPTGIYTVRRFALAIMGFHSASAMSLQS